MKIGVVILNFNTGILTKQLAEKLSSYESVFKIVVVDNVSTDNSYEVLKTINNKKIDVVLSDRNGGYSYGNNFGVNYLKKYNIDIVFICNPDVLIDEEDLIKISKPLELDKNLSISSGIEYSVNNKVILPVYWKLNTYVDDLLDCSYLYRIFKKNKKNNNFYKISNDFQYVDIMKGSLFAVKMADFLSVGGFDEEFFLFCEERVLSAKILKLNKKIVIVNNAKYIHNHSYSINEAYKKYGQMKLLYKSRMLFNKKYRKIGMVKQTILHIMMNISLFEFYLNSYIKKGN